MPVAAASGAPIVVVVDAMELRRALVVHFLKDWAAAEKVRVFSFAPNDAHAALREGIDCRMIIFAGAPSCSSAVTLAEVKVLRIHLPFPDEPSLKGKPGVHAEVLPHEVLGTEPMPAATVEPLPSSQLPELSARQKAILEGLCRGEPNKIIGRALNLPELNCKGPRPRDYA